MSLLTQGAKEEWNPRTAVRLFSLEFEERWGPRHPTFFEGSYREALSRAKQEYKFLLVYLHSDSHPNTSTFCRYVSAPLLIAGSTLIFCIGSDVLCADRVLSFLNGNFVIWAMSVVYPAGYEMSTTLGATSFPFVSLLDGYNMQNGQHVVAEGETTADALIDSLVVLMEEQGASLVAARAHKYALSTPLHLRTTVMPFHQHISFPCVFHYCCVMVIPTGPNLGAAARRCCAIGNYWRSRTTSTCGPSPSTRPRSAR